MSDWTPSDAQIDAAWAAWVSDPIGGNDHEKRKLRAALIAAHAAAPPVDTTEIRKAASKYGVLAEDVGTVRTSIWSRLPENEKGREAPQELVNAIQERDAALQHLIDLFVKASAR